MIIDIKTYYVMVIPLVISFLSCYWLISEIIWSIVKCNINKRTIRSAELKKSRNISMSYLSEYISIFYRQYVFWMKIKFIYVVVESVWLLIYVLLPLFVETLQLPFYANIVLTFLPTCFVVFQFDAYHNTKFDRYRLNKKTKRK